MSTYNPPQKLDQKTKEIRLLRLELLNLQKQFLNATIGLLSRLDSIDPPEKPYTGRPKTREQAKRHFSKIAGL